MEVAASERRMRGARNRAQIPAFGNWDFDQVPITQYFECCARPLPNSASARASVYPYARSYPHSGYVGDEFLGMFDAEDEFHGLHDSAPKQHHVRTPPSPNMTSIGEVKGQRGTRRTRRRRSSLDNTRKVFHVTESGSNPNDSVLTPDLYEVVSAENFQHSEPKKKKNVKKAKDEDLYKIPPELLPAPKRKKMRKFFTKYFVTICASY